MNNNTINIYFTMESEKDAFVKYIKDNQGSTGIFFKEIQLDCIVCECYNQIHPQNLFNLGFVLSRIRFELRYPID